MIRRVFLGAGLLWAGVALLGAQAPTPASAERASAGTEPARAPAPAPAPSGAARGVAHAPRGTPPPHPADLDKQKAWVKQYCVSCHNTRNPLPANDPVNLETASLDDLTKDAATWERVLRKLNVRAMPPQGMPHPTEASYGEFTGWLTSSLDRGWQGKATPGRYVVHRLNRAEYRNAIRDLLSLDVDVSALLPNDGGDFGFDNIASALTTSPLLLDGYVTAAQRISTLAVGDPKVQPTTAEFLITAQPLAERARRRAAARHARRSRGAPRLPRRRRVQAAGAALSRHRRGLLRRRRQRPPEHVHRHDRRRGGLQGGHRRPRGSRRAGQEHERHPADHRRADDGHRQGHGRTARRRLHLQGASGPAAGRLGAVAARQPGDPLHGWGAEAEDRRHRRARTRSPASARRRAGSGCSSARRKPAAEEARLRATASSSTSPSVPTGAR